MAKKADRRKKTVPVRPHKRRPAKLGVGGEFWLHWRMVRFKVQGPYSHPV